jgi:hypothetical protein
LAEGCCHSNEKMTDGKSEMENERAISPKKIRLLEFSPPRQLAGLRFTSQFRHSRSAVSLPISRSVNSFRIPTIKTISRTGTFYAAKLAGQTGILFFAYVGFSVWIGADRTRKRQFANQRAQNHRSRMDADRRRLPNA